MSLLLEKFQKLGCDNAPGQEGRQNLSNLNIVGETFGGALVDFSHGDVDAFEPTPGALEIFLKGYHIGGKVAYTEYKGATSTREHLVQKLTEFSHAPILPQDIIITPGTQAALFLAIGATVVRGTKVAIVEPDYFANRKLVEFFEGEMFPIQMDYMQGAKTGDAGLDMAALEDSFKKGVEVFLFSNPNNPTGAIYSAQEIKKIGALAKQYNVTVIADELYSRQVFENNPYTHLRAQADIPENIITIIGPSKTESLSGFRLGVAYGTSQIIERMEKLQAIVSLRAPGYSQKVLETWFAEPHGWMAERILQHQRIRDDIAALLEATPGVEYRKTDGGSYLFVTVPKLTVDISTFVKILKVQANVIVTPGTEFGPAFTQHFRINFSQDHTKAVDAIKRTLKVLDFYRA